jgi:membrane protease subunit (stomatin/prohibitin family)
MRVVGDLNQYTRFQTADSIDEAAAASGGVAGMGAGLAIGQQMGAAMGGGGAAPGAAGGLSEDVFAQIEKLHKLKDMGALTQEEYDAKKAALLARL